MLQKAIEEKPIWICILIHLPLLFQELLSNFSLHESFDNISWNCRKIRIEMRLSKKFNPIVYLFSSCLEFVIAHWVVILILVSFYVIFFCLTFFLCKTNHQYMYFFIEMYKKYVLLYNTCKDQKQFNSTLCTACFLFEYHTTIAPPQSQILAQK